MPQFLILIVCYDYDRPLWIGMYIWYRFQVDTNILQLDISRNMHAEKYVHGSMYMVYTKWTLEGNQRQLAVALTGIQLSYPE